VYARWLAEATGVDIFRLKDLRISLPRQYRTGVSGSFTHPGKIQKKPVGYSKTRTASAQKNKKLSKATFPQKVREGCFFSFARSLRLSKMRPGLCLLFRSYIQKDPQALEEFRN
jgi:hypothetical protein